jgi:hypothetical protein
MDTTGSFSEGLDPEMLAAVFGGAANPKALRMKVLQSSLRSRVNPAPMAARPTVAPVAPDAEAPAAAVPAGPDFNTQRARIEAALEELNQPKDLSALQSEGKRRGTQGTSSLLMALAAQQAGPEFGGIQQHMLRQAMAARDPLKFSGGIVNEEGQVVEDPNYKAQEQRSMYERRLAGIDRGENAAAMAAAERARREEATRMNDQRARELQADRLQQSLLLKSMGAAGKGGGAAEKPLKPMPASMQKAWLENQNSLTAVERAKAAVDAYPAAFGPSNVIGDFAKQYTDPKGVAARAAVSDIGSLKIHDRSGAAVTAMEFPRLKPFIPNMTDKPEVVKQKLDNFWVTYNDIQAEIAGFAEQQGYRAPVVKSSAGAGAPPAAAPSAAPPAAGGLSPAEQAELDQLRSRFGKR